MLIENDQYCRYQLGRWHSIEVLGEEFNSDNTKRLTVEETKEKIASLEYIQNELKGIENIAK